MRLFFALGLSAQEKLQIEAWRDKALPPIAGKVPAANFHITLAFLGQTSEAQHELLVQGADEVQSKCFDLHFQHLGYFAKPKALWLGADNTPVALTDLVASLSAVAKRAGLPAENRRYIPHITLFRKCKENPPAPLIEPSFQFRFSEFGLYQSLNKGHGVEYQCLQTWRLGRASLR